jgi:periplasmic protein TonB
MAYADQPTMSTRKLVAIGLVVLLHAALGYAFVTGLAFNVVKKVAQDLKTFDVVEEPPPPPEEPPPPPPEQPRVEVPPPPIVSPPPIVQTPVVAPPIQTVVNAPPPVITPTAPTAPPAPPAPPAVSQASPPKARGQEGSWVTRDDYPSRALREEQEGVVGITFEVTPDGRAANCRVTTSSGRPDLDNATCPNWVRRARYTPAKDQAGNNISATLTRRVRWQLEN